MTSPLRTVLRSIRDWCNEDEGGHRHLAGHDGWRARGIRRCRTTAAILEDLIAFEGRARDLRMRWNDCPHRQALPASAAQPLPRRPAARPWPRTLRTLQGRSPPPWGDAVVASGKRLEELKDHERSLARIAERDRAAARDRSEALDDYAGPPHASAWQASVRRPGASASGATRRGRPSTHGGP